MSNRQDEKGPENIKVAIAEKERAEKRFDQLLARIELLSQNYRRRSCYLMNCVANDLDRIVTSAKTST